MTYYFKVKGKVQGVGYRYFVQSNALQLNLKGWIRNLSDGAVEGVIQGSEGHVEKMIELLKRGPFFSKVTDSEFKEISTENLDTFNVLATK